MKNLRDRNEGMRITIDYSKTLLKEVIVTLDQEHFAYDDSTPTIIRVKVNGQFVPIHLYPCDYAKAATDLNGRAETKFCKSVDDKSFDLMSVVSDILRNYLWFYSNDLIGYQFTIINCHDEVIAISPSSGQFFGQEALAEANAALLLCK